MSKHTPGPWYAKREGYSTVYVEARIGDRLIQEVAACGPTDAGQEQQDANALLIAAAPELLEALKSWVVYDTDDTDDGAEIMIRYDKALTMTRAAIAKAEVAL